VVLIAGLIAVILIPGKIWEQESADKLDAQNNMSSIYEAERYYHLVNGEYTVEPGKLMQLVSSDSALFVRQQVVNYTRTLMSHLDAYFKITMIKTLSEINQNFSNIADDLDANEIYFKAVPEIADESTQLIVDMKGAYMNGFDDLRLSLHMLDSLTRLKRDFSDYTLQTDAVKSLGLTDTINTLLDGIDMKAVFNTWGPISKRLEAFSKKVNRTVIKENTSVADRIKNFKQKIDDAFAEMKSADKNSNISKAAEINNVLKGIYEEFLGKFFITSKKALYSLSVEDSLVIGLVEDNFYSPVLLPSGEKQMYKIIISDDSSAVKVESPILLEDLRTKAAPVAEIVNKLTLLPRYEEYFDSLISIKNKSLAIKSQLRRNPDIFFKQKEVAALISKYNDISLYSAYSDLNKFTKDLPETQSYSKIKANIEIALSGSRMFKQAYQDNFFGNLDSLHIDLVVALQEYDSLLQNVRRLPKGIVGFSEDIKSLDAALEQVKNPGKKKEIVESLGKMEKILEDAFIFAEKGKTITTYGIFNKKIENFGYIYKDSKSWEE
jgi:hypothetical protein